MDVGSTFRIYGDYFGWYLFGQLYQFLMVSGLWLIPYFFYYFKSIFGNSGGGEGFQFKPFASLKTLEMLIITSIFIYMLFMVPYVPANKSTFVFNNGSTVQTNGNTGTTYDDLATALPGNTVKIPAGWYAVLWLTTGINSLVKSILPTGTDVRNLMYQQQQMAIDNPEVKKEFVAFTQHCLQPAMIRFNVVSQQYRNSQLFAKLSEIQQSVGENDAFKIALSYPGNLYFTTYLYNNNICSGNDIGGQNSLCIPKTGGVLSPENAGYGYTHCNTWWTSSLRENLRKDLTNWNGVLWSTKGLFLDLGKHTGISLVGNDEVKDRMIYGKLGESNAHVSDKGLGDNSEGWGWSWFKEKLTAVFVAIGGFFLQFPTTAIKFLLPIILGATIMVIIMLLPIMVVATLYKPDKILQLVLLLFGICFLPAIWHITAWIDNVVLKVIWGNKSYIEGVFSLGHGLWNIFSLVMYLYLTKWWLQYLATLSGRAAQGIATMADGAGEGAKATNQGQNAIRK